MALDNFNFKGIHSLGISSHYFSWHPLIELISDRQISWAKLLVPYLHIYVTDVIDRIPISILVTPLILDIDPLLSMSFC